MELTNKARVDFNKWYDVNYNDYHYLFTNDEKYTSVINNIIIEWFDSVGIFIYIDSIQSQDSRSWRFHIHRVSLENIREDEYCINRKDATQNSIIKANEIYNNMSYVN